MARHVHEVARDGYTLRNINRNGILKGHLEIVLSLQDVEYSSLKGLFGKSIRGNAAMGGVSGSVTVENKISLDTVPDSTNPNTNTTNFANLNGTSPSRRTIPGFAVPALAPLQVGEKRGLLHASDLSEAERNKLNVMRSASQDEAGGTGSGAAAGGFKVSELKLYM